MVVVTKNPAQWRNNTGAWGNPDRATGPHDGLCALKTTAELGNYDFEVYDYGFSIPAGSTINHVYGGLHALNAGTSLNRDCQLRITKGSTTWAISAAYSLQMVVPCSAAVSTESELWGSWSPDDLNNPNFTSILRAALVTQGSIFAIVDYVWIRVDYTEPAPAVKIAYSDGLVSVSA